MCVCVCFAILKYIEIFIGLDTDKPSPNVPILHSITINTVVYMCLSFVSLFKPHVDVINNHLQQPNKSGWCPTDSVGFYFPILLAVATKKLLLVIIGDQLLRYP